MPRNESGADAALARYEFRRKLEELRGVRGRATELISLYIPPGRVISDVSNYLRNEYAQSSNIKSRTTRNNVMWAIDSLVGKLKHYKRVPEHGIVFFVGNKAVGSDKTEQVSIIIEPPEPINIYKYYCDSVFFLQPLEDMLLEKELYGLIVIDRKEATLGLLSGKRIVVIKNVQSLVPSKHGRGGQSQRRFERLIEIAAHEFYVKIAGLCTEAFLTKKELKGLIVGGPGATKDYFVNEGYLHHELKKKVIPTFFDVGYTDESGLKELVGRATDTLSDIALAKEKKLMQRFMEEIRKTDGLFMYGENEIRSALAIGAVDLLYLSEGLRKHRLKLKCMSCGNAVEETLVHDAEPMEKCPKCGQSLSVEEKTDVVDELYKLAGTSKSKVELISEDSDEGKMLLTAFGGIAAILRYRVA
jgi:peptide chain release factor subunit 1